MIETILQILQAGLSLWDSYEKRKYVDELMDLKKRYYEEVSKADFERSDAVLDDIRIELCILGAAFCSAAQNANSANKSEPAKP